MTQGEHIEKDLRIKSGKRGSIKTIIIILIVLIALITSVYLYTHPKQEVQTSSDSEEQLIFVSSADSQIQQEIENMTGYNWQSFINADGSENSKLAAILLLANEVSVIDDQFNYINKFEGISDEEWSGLGLKRLEILNTSKEGFMELIENLKSLQQFYLSKGFSSSEIRIKRLNSLYSYINKYGLPEGSIDSLDTQFLVGKLLGMTPENYEKAEMLMIIRYNSVILKD